MSEFVPSQRLVVDDSITTGQAVTLEINPASPLLRVAAALVDIWLTVCVGIIIVFAAVQILPMPSASMLRVYVISLLVFLFVVMPVAIEFFTRGRSLGKWALGLQVVRDDGGAINLRHSMVRGIVALPELWLSLGSLALVTTMLNLRAKRLGDFAAGTMVISQPEHIAYPIIIMPPDAVEWASSAQVPRLPEAVVQRATMFLRSNYSLLPGVREETALGLAEELYALVEPKPPADLHPERFIAAVLVINRDREAKKLNRWEAVRESSTEYAKQTAFGI